VKRERRHLTVMFCDLIDSTPLGERLDPEDLHEVTRLYQQAAALPIRRYEGHIARYVGDGLLVYFGYPLAHEDDAVRAVHAALGIVGELRTLNGEIETRFGVRLSVRIGVHSGPVVVGETGDGVPDQEQVLGHTMNVAARLQGFAAADTVIVSGATLRLIEGMFDTEALGSRSLRGVARPVRVYRVRGTSGAERRSDSAPAAQINPLVGRDREFGLLRDAWAHMCQGRGQAVLLSGEAGIGKSRLLQALREAVADTAPPWLECRSSPYTRGSAFYPLIQQQRRAFGLHRSDSPEAQAGRLEAALRQAGCATGDAVALFAALHSLPLPPSHEPPRLSPEGQRRRTLELLGDWLLHGCGAPPVLVFEDLHWVDESSLELLGMVLGRLQREPALVLLTHRPDFAPPWSGPHITHVPLNRLTRESAAALVQHTAGRRPLSDDLVAEVVRRADGIPLFAEELTKALLESDQLERPDGVRTASPGQMDIPATLQDLLMGRLDRLGAAKHVAQLAAILGREFPHDLLAAVAEDDPAALRDQLGRLIEAGLLEQRGQLPHATYGFRHALIREAAYESLPKAIRQQHHEHIGRVLEQHFPDVVDAQPELVAHHLTAGGIEQAAIGYWQRAAQRAMVRSANVEAVRFATEALRLLGGMPGSAERNQHELALRSMIGFGLAATKGYGADEVERAFARARDLCEELGAIPQLVPVLYGLHAFYMVRAERRPTIELAEQLLQIAHDIDDSSVFMAIGPTAITRFWQGEHRASTNYLNRVCALYSADRHHALAYTQGQEPGAVAHMYLALTRWFLGYPDQAVTYMDEAVSIASREPHHPLTLTMVMNFAGDLRYFRREATLQRELAERTVALSLEHRFSLWLAGAKSSTGWARVEGGALTEGIAEIRQSLDMLRATGALLNRPLILGKLAAALLRAGAIPTGLEAVEQATALAQTNLDQYWEPELYRLKGELLLALSDPQHAAAEASLQHALALARAQHAKSLELRAAYSLAAHWSAQRRPGEAAGLLRSVYEWFTEGLTTPDLRAARDLLATLA
jgi:class 3 adenylate cyclase/predicted ATPase